MIKSCILIFACILNLNATYENGKDVFLEKCATCHVEYVGLNKLIDNFRNHKNKLLNLQAQPFNRIEYKILRGKKQIGSPADDIDMRRESILEYLKDYLTNPRFEISLASKRAKSHFPKKKSMKGLISNQEYLYLIDFIMEYKKKHTFNIQKNESNIDEKFIIKNAIKNNKKIIVEATTNSCHYCKKMKDNVLSLDEIKYNITNNYIFIEVNVDNTSLPFDLQKHFPNITPTFFFLDSNSKLKNMYPGAWNKKDFLKLLNDNN